jgi:hypothetical protein
MRAIILLLISIAFVASFVPKQPVRWIAASLSAKVWVEEADDGFVDEEENLEEGEVCLRAVKSFAGDPKRLLCAGALVARPSPSRKVDAWMADAILDDGLGGPNLQVQGAVQVLDDILLFYLKERQNSTSSARLLRDFHVQCGSAESEFTCASYQAALVRGFAPHKTIMNLDDGMRFDPSVGVERYQKIAEESKLSPMGVTAAEILSLLPRLALSREEAPNVDTE